MNLDPELSEQLKRVLAALEPLLPKPVEKIDWATCHAANWHRSTFSGTMEPVPSIEGIHLDDLLGIEPQKQIVEENTRQFLAGLPANNTLLWGTRGTGKSSLVRALLHAFAHQGLRIIQVDKDDLVSLPAIVEQLKAQPFKFIVFSDDLSFESGDASYKVLKSALDGSVYALPENVLIYVTSNRRHLVPEYESDNRGAMLVEGERTSTSTSSAAGCRSWARRSAWASTSAARRRPRRSCGPRRREIAAAGSPTSSPATGSVGPSWHAGADRLSPGARPGRPSTRLEPGSRLVGALRHAIAAVAALVARLARRSLLPQRIRDVLRRPGRLHGSARLGVRHLGLLARHVTPPPPT